MPDAEQPLAETLKKVEIRKVTENFDKKKGKGKTKLLNYEERLEETYCNKSYTFVQHLGNEGVNSVKAAACKKQTHVRVSASYISSKLLINAKISLASFILFVFLMKKPHLSTLSIRSLKNFLIF